MNRLSFMHDGSEWSGGGRRCRLPAEDFDALLGRHAR
jgi:hypothetical protein